MMHILGIEATKVYNVDTRQQDYTRLIVSQDIVDFLSNHDVEITAEGKKIFIVNKVRYIYMGLQIEPVPHLYKEQFVS